MKDPILREITDDHGDSEEAKKAKRKDLVEAHSNWFHDKSDLLGVLRAIGAFEYAGGTEEFCYDKFLHYKVCV